MKRPEDKKQVNVQMLLLFFLFTLLPPPPRLLIQHNRLCFTSPIGGVGLLKKINKRAHPAPPPYLLESSREACCSLELSVYLGHHLPSPAPYYFTTSSRLQLRVCPQTVKCGQNYSSPFLNFRVGRFLFPVELRCLKKVGSTNTVRWTHHTAPEQ